MYNRLTLTSKFIMSVAFRRFVIHITGEERERRVSVKIKNKRTELFTVHMHLEDRSRGAGIGRIKARQRKIFE